MRLLLSFLIFIFSATAAIAQIGVKAGFSSPSGFHAGLSIEKLIREESEVSLQVEGFYHNVGYSRKIPEKDSNNKVSTKIENRRKSIFQLPISIKKEFTGKSITPFFKLGGGPSFQIVKETTEFNGFAQLGGGINYKKISLEGIYNLSFINIHPTIMVSLGYYFSK